MTPLHRSNHHMALAVLFVLVLIVAACGSRRSFDEIAAGSIEADGIENRAPQDGRSGSTSADTDGAADAGEFEVEDDGGAEGNAPGGSRSQATVPGDGGGSTAPSAVGDQPSGDGTGEVVVATVGHFSGIAGAVFAEGGRAVQAWAQWVNDRGGIGGRPVRVLYLDDGADPSRHRQVIQDAVENQGAVAIVGEFSPLAGSSSVEYLNRARIPVIGGQTSDAWFSDSAMHFPTTPAGDDSFLANTAATVEVAKAEGTTNYGIIYCVESASCSVFSAKVERFATQLGMSVVYNQGASIAQPDFTAECLNAAERGVEVFMVGLDGASLRRLAASCARQGYRPRFFQPPEGIEVAMLEDPNLDGLLGPSVVHPVLVGPSPAGPELADAIRSYMGQPDNLLLATLSFHAGLVLEAALEGVGGEATSDAVLDGLWALDGDDFGGISAPLSFAEGTPNRVPPCYWVVAIDDGAFVLPDGGKRHCREPVG